MNKFSFGLDSVLVYRKLVEDREQQKLHVIQASIHEAKQLQQTLRADIHRHLSMLAPKENDPIDILLLRNLASYVGKLQADLAKTTHLITRLEEDESVQLDKLLRARQAREIVEKLKEKKFAIHEKELLVMEQKLLDEGSATRFVPGS